MIKTPERTRESSALRRVSPLKIGVLVGFLAVFGGVRSAIADRLGSEDRGQRAVPALVDPELPPDTRKILEIEAALAALETQILPVLDQYVQYPAMKTRIRRIFNLFRENRKNPRRFAPNGPIAIGAEKGFYYQLVDSLPNSMYACFNGQYRVIQIPRNFDPSDTGMLLQLVHEASHVLDDDEMRKGDPARYAAFWATAADGKAVAVPESEASAIAASLEALDAHAHGGLEKSARRARTIRESTRDSSLVEDIGVDSRMYFDTPSRFPAYIRKLFQRRANAVLFTPDLRKI